MKKQITAEDIYDMIREEYPDYDIEHLKKETDNRMEDDSWRLLERFLNFSKELSDD
jgi:threonine synthase